MGIISGSIYSVVQVARPGEVFKLQVHRIPVASLAHQRRQSFKFETFRFHGLGYLLGVFGADLAFYGQSLRNGLVMRTLLNGLTRYVPERDTITEVLIVLGIVMGIFILSKIDYLPSFTPPVSSYASEASPRPDQK